MPCIPVARPDGVTDEVLAYHEAGHAVVAAAMERRILWVTIDSDRLAAEGHCGVLGYCNLVSVGVSLDECTKADLRRTPSLVRHLRARPVWVMAADLAQQRGAPRVSSIAATSHDHAPKISHAFQTLFLAQALDPIEGDREFERRVSEEAGAMVDEHWAVIQRLAQHLTQERWLDGAAAHASIGF